MPKLGDILGTIVREVTRAKARADFETVYLARVYQESKDDLLREMPVPHFRLPEVTVELPIAIGDIEPGNTDWETELKNMLAQPTNDQIEEALKTSAQESGAEIAPAKLKSIAANVGKGWKNIWTGPKVIIGSGPAVKELSKSLDEELEKPDVISRGGETKKGDIKKSFEKKLQDIIYAKLRSGGSVEAIARTGNIKEISDPSLLTHIRFTITEECYEMAVGIDESGNETRKWVPE